MNCQNCEAPVLPADERCERCGAKLLHQRAILGVPKAENFALTVEEPPGEFDEPESPPAHDDWDFPQRMKAQPSAAVLATQDDEIHEPRWGGFFRRLGACLIDMIVIVFLAALMGIMSYIGYKVGLSAHDRVISWHNAAPLMSLLTFAWIGLASTYFVAFHGMEGKTIGKWLFGLRVVGVDQRPITYRRALLRWIGTVGLGCASFGLAFLWILWQREKRGWHDLLARTWVVRQ